MAKCVGTLLDQGFIALSNFLVSLMVARSVGPAQYGVYSMLFAGFLLMANLHQAVLLEPMLVLQPELFPSRGRQYIGTVLKLHGIGSAVWILLAGGAALFARPLLGPEFYGPVIALAVSAPFILLLWTMRIGAYVEGATAAVAGGALFYGAAALGGLALLRRADALSPASAFLLTAFCALLTGLFLIVRLKPTFSRATSSPGLAEVWRRQWRYGRWSLAGVSVQWVHNSSFAFLSASFLGLAETGALTALTNLTLPITHLTWAISRLVLPHLARIRTRAGTRALKRPVRTLTLVLFGVVFSYWALASALHAPLFSILYGDRFTTVAPLVPWATLSIVFWTCMIASELGLRAILASSAVFRVYIVSAALSLLLGVPAVRVFGLYGVFGTAITCSLVSLALAMTLFIRNANRREPDRELDVLTDGLPTSERG